MEGHSCIRTKVLAEDVFSDGTVQIIQVTLSRGMISCVTLLRRASESVDQSKLVLLNVKIKSRESPMHNTMMKNNQEEPKKLGYALEI